MSSTLFWLAKDIAWIEDNKSLWFVYLLPTIGTAIDFYIISLNQVNYTIDSTPFLALLLWVLGNAVWALGEFFWGQYDDPIRFWDESPEAVITARWYSSWILLCAFLPILACHAVWIPLTLTGKLKEYDDSQVIFGDLQSTSQDNEFPSSTKLTRYHERSHLLS